MKLMLSQHHCATPLLEIPVLLAALGRFLKAEIAPHILVHLVPNIFTLHIIHTQSTHWLCCCKRNADSDQG